MAAASTEGPTMVVQAASTAVGQLFQSHSKSLCFLLSNGVLHTNRNVHCSCQPHGGEPCHELVLRVLSEKHLGALDVACHAEHVSEQHAPFGWFVRQVHQALHLVQAEE